MKNVRKDGRKSPKNKAIITVNSLPIQALLALALGTLMLLPTLTHAAAPSVSTDLATRIGATSAQINGFVHLNSNEPSTTAWFEWGKTTSLERSSDPLTRFNKTSFDIFAKLTNLEPNTTYYYRAIAENSSGRSAGQMVSFNTKSFSGNGGTTSYNTPSNTNDIIASRIPAIQTTFASTIGDNTATLNGFIDPKGTGDASRWFEWGVSQALGNVSGYSGAIPVPHTFSYTLMGLQKGTTYYFRAVARNSSGTVQGSIFSFTTGVIAQNTTTGIAPVVLADRPTVSGGSASVSALVVAGSAPIVGGYFEWGTNPASLDHGTMLQTLNTTGSQRFANTITGLSVNTSYVYRAVVQDTSGTTYRSPIIAFGSGSYSGNLGGSTGSGNKVIPPATESSQANAKTSNGKTAAASVFFSKAPVALFGWFLAIIFLIISIILFVMLRRANKNHNGNSDASVGAGSIKKTDEFKEFPPELLGNLK